MMVKIYETSGEVHVGVVKLYGDKSASKLYMDEGHTEEPKAEEAERLFVLGRMLIESEDKLLSPVAKTSSGYVTYDGTEAVTWTV